MGPSFRLTCLTNKAKIGRSTTDADCRKIVAMPFIRFEGSGKSAQVWDQLVNRFPLLASNQFLKINHQPS